MMKLSEQIKEVQTIIAGMEAKNIDHKDMKLIATAINAVVESSIRSDTLSALQANTIAEIADKIRVATIKKNVPQLFNGNGDSGPINEILMSKKGKMN